MKKLTIHIGYPKTATTSLQLNVFSSLMREGKIEYLNHLNRKDENLGTLYCGNIIKYVTGMGELKKCQEELKNLSTIKKEISIISNENLSIFCDDFTWDNFNPTAAFNASRIHAVLSEYFDEIKIVMTLRAQKTLIPSFYAQYFKHFDKFNKKTATLSAWLENNLASNIADDDLMFNFDVMYSSYCHFFGENNIDVLLYEDLKHDKEAFYNQFSKILKIEPDYLAKLLETNIKNKTSNTASNKLITETPRLGDILLPYLKSPLKKILPTPLFNMAKQIYKRCFSQLLSSIKTRKIISIDNITTDQQLFVQQRFKQSNINLAKKLGLPLTKFEAYGYLEKQ